MRTAFFLATLLTASVATAKPMRKPVSYQHEGVTYEGVLVWDDAAKGPRPGLLLIPNWLGINEANLKQAELVAGRKYVIFVADMYGKNARPKNQKEAAQASGAVKGDRRLMAARASAALDAMKRAGKTAGMELKKIGAIGFCFGGTVVLELAKRGGQVSGVVSFHGGLDAVTPTPQGLSARILALHGADDPAVPEKDLQAFIADLKQSRADWALVQFGNAVHSFTDVDADNLPVSKYNPKVARRAYEMMHDFFDETFAG
ncbi:MAG TPA: dienelactone hydrolase family protein [Myxococcaceae bacterium]|nr:dienelactone hydrolase family protein [Myxococcaceae bacterium]